MARLSGLYSTELPMNDDEDFNSGSGKKIFNIKRNV